MINIKGGESLEKYIYNNNKENKLELQGFCFNFSIGVEWNPPKGGGLRPIGGGWECRVMRTLHFTMQGLSLLTN